MRSYLICTCLCHPFTSQKYFHYVQKKPLLTTAKLRNRTFIARIKFRDDINLFIIIPVLEEPAANVFNLCNTANCMAVYGITISKAGTFPRQKPYSMQSSWIKSRKMVDSLHKISV
jgi:hypothetical protein